MSNEPAWALPQDYSVSVFESGTMQLFRDDRPLQIFLADTPRERVEAFADGYDLGRDHGFDAGEKFGRVDLAADLRQLLQIA